MGFHYVGQAGLELLTLGDLPAQASQSAGTTGVSHHIQSWILFLVLKYIQELACIFFPKLSLRTFAFFPTKQYERGNSDQFIILAN